jgi:hypothetical protein
MKKIYYEKVGRRYKPVAEYDNDYMDSFPKGNTLVICRPGSTSRKYNVDAAFAPLIAAAHYAENAMVNAILLAANLRPTQTPITEGQRKAWKKLATELGSDLCTLQGSSTHDIVAAGLKVLQDEADKLLQHAAVKHAYDQFMLVCALTKEHANEQTN